jgi:hypothetical protein
VGVVQVAECLPSKNKVLSSNPSTKTKQEEEEEKSWKNTLLTQ